MRPVDPYRANHFNILGVYMKSKKKGANTNPGKPGSQKIDKSEVKLFVTA